MADIKTLQKNIRVRNLYVISLIVVLISISFLSLIILFKQQKEDAELINLAGSQRMLSQKIAYFSYIHHQNLSLNIVDQSINKDLLESAYAFSTNQERLTVIANNQPDIIPEEVASIYIHGPIYLNNKIERYAESAIALSKTSDEEVAKGIVMDQFEPKSVEGLLHDLDQVVSKIEQHINARITFSEMLKTVFWLVAMVLLVSFSFFIFRPLQKLIKKSYLSLFTSKQRSVELSFAINKHAIVYRIENDGSITEVNSRFCEFFCYTEEEVIGLNVMSICSDTYDSNYLQNIFRECAENEYWHGESINKLKGGRELWLSTTIVPLKNDNNKIESFIVIQNDISEIKHTEFVLQQLHYITSNQDKVLGEKIQSILALGKQIFNLPLALISEIDNEEYKVLYCDTPNAEILSGTVFELSNTYCFHTYLADHAIAFHQAGDSTIKSHPCYENFGLESYIGVPLVVDGKRFGTLNFSGVEPSPKPFTARELDLIQLFSHWIGSELTRANHENELLAQQSLMEQIGKQARIGVWEINMINETIYWSNVTKDIHEVPSDYQPNLSTAINFYKEGYSRNTITELVEQTIKTGTPFEKDLQLVTAKGNEVWVSARGRADLENGKCVRMFGSFQDITDKVLAQQKMSEDSQRMRLAADSAGFGVWVYNLIDNNVTWDNWMYTVYGISPDVKESPFSLWENSLHPDDKESAVSELSYAIENKSKFDTQYRIIWPDGTIKHIKAAATVIYDHAEVPISVIGVNYDLTEREENAIALTKAKVQADLAVTAKNEFFASMSHEIRTPMNGVIGMLDLVKESKLNQEQKHRIGIAQQSAKSLLSLINDVLDFSKIDANKLELENISFNLIKMAGDLADASAQQAQSKSLELILDTVEVEESLVVGDSNRIRQILTNLVANAIKFTKQGEVVIRLRQQHHSNSHWRITIEVSDTGIGIPKDKQTALFEAFSQVDASTTREYGGTGLGLAIVKKLCACMQGSIRVESAEGKGSVFICDLLLEKSKDTLLSLPEKQLQDKRVLIIEDNATCGEVIKRQFEHWQMNVQLISNGKEALSLLISQVDSPQFDLILMNRHLADKEGLVFAKKVRQHPELDGLKIMFMTLMASQNDLADLVKIGISGHFPKPVTVDDLYRALNTTLNLPPVEQGIDESEKATSINDKDCNWKQGTRLLLVEDNRVNQMVALGVLKKIGIKHVVVAVNGLDAIAKLKSSDDEPFNFIFMDCQMPEMDGYQATKMIREGSAGACYQNIPIVAMTANAMLGDEQKCLDAGMDDYLVKPINKDKICNTLQIFMNQAN
ncbi:response regulator [Pseudocolwellia sp. HL-MZ19]|uniref:response regulator n=1 Tax=Pseudocolwellia sp. HL-MZ19 TaxID=3400846 RepID=UPI003CF7DC07